MDQETSVPVPEVLATGADGYVAAYQEKAPRKAEYADGVLTEAWLRAAGRTLAHLHEEVTFDRHGLLAVDGGPALLHGWFTPEHASVRGGTSRCVLDFEHALFLGEGWDHDDGAATFRAAYESVRSLPFDVAASRGAYVALVSASYLDSLHA